MNKNEQIVIYCAGTWGKYTLLKCIDENIPVKAFVDRNAENIVRFCGYDVFTLEEAEKQFADLPFIVALTPNNEEAIKTRKAIYNACEEKGLRVYEDFDMYFQGPKDCEYNLVECGSYDKYEIAEDILKKNKKPIVYSFGIGFDYTFETELVKRYNAEIYAFDPSPLVKSKIDKKGGMIEGIHFYPYGLSDENAETEFFLPRYSQDYSIYYTPWTATRKTSFQTYTLKTLMEKFGHNHLDILKMDIEGSEFKALPNILKECPCFDQLCIEFHTRIFPDSVAVMHKYTQMIKDAGYTFVCNGRQEQTYIRTDLIK